ncbi:hypothetical protein DY245_42135 [Streptomyces inhibens]|uniref:Cysteine-rich CPCC domain-containing protein n=1 Tax=Streptomyces inhibens TaxID=2293571 RepID=A0A371PQA6_STRIH|nr:hypothetical protein DY245_42135 [Streptomyces inhibens]
MGLACFVCGLAQGVPPWGDDGKTPTFDICPCCGSEFGYEDATDAGVFRARRRWSERGYAWEDPKARPEGWDFGVQLQNALQKNG